MSREALDLALKRLSAAIDQLEAAEARRARAETARASLEEEYAIMQDDRLRLAVELDAALARNKALMTTNGEVAKRLQRTGALVRELLGGADGGTPLPTTE